MRKARTDKIRALEYLQQVVATADPDDIPWVDVDVPGDVPGDGRPVRDTHTGRVFARLQLADGDSVTVSADHTYFCW